MMIEESSTFFGLLNPGICLHEEVRISLSPSSPPLRSPHRSDTRVDALPFATIHGNRSCFRQETRMKCLLGVFKVLVNGKNVVTWTHGHGEEKFVWKARRVFFKYLVLHGLYSLVSQL